MKIACPTCLDSFTSSCEISSIPCGHVFHSECIKKWFETGKHNCPQCRDGFQISQVHKLFFPIELTENDYDAETNLKCIELEKENQKLVKDMDKSLAAIAGALSRERQANKKFVKVQEENLKMKETIHGFECREVDLKKRLKKAIHWLKI